MAKATTQKIAKTIITSIKVNPNLFVLPSSCTALMHSYESSDLRRGIKRPLPFWSSLVTSKLRRVAIFADHPAAALFPAYAHSYLNQVGAS